MAEAVAPIPQGFHTLTPHLSVNGGVRFMEFLKRAFGATEIHRMPAPDGRLMHAQTRLGDSMLMFSDFFPEMGGAAPTEGRWPFVLQIYVPDADATWGSALEAGCQVVSPIADQFWGDRYGQVKDPFGFIWAIATRKEELTPEQMMERQRAAFGGQR